MGSKPSVAAAARGAAPVDKQPPRSDRLGRHPDDASHHHDHADGHSPLRHAKHAPPELQALFKHLCFQTSIRRGSDRVVNLQEVLMEELGIAKPDRKQLGEVVDMVCENPDSPIAAYNPTWVVSTGSGVQTSLCASQCTYDSQSVVERRPALSRVADG